MNQPTERIVRLVLLLGAIAGIFVCVFDGPQFILNLRQLWAEEFPISAVNAPTQGTSTTLPTTFAVASTPFATVAQPTSTSLPTVPRPPVATPGTQIVNLAFNPSFESDFFNGWNSEGNQKFSPGPGHSGGRALCSTQTGTDPNLWAIVSQTIRPIKPGATYMFTVWLNTKNAAQFHLRFDWFNDKSAPISIPQADAAFDGDSEGWVQRGGSQVAPPSVSSVNIKILHGLKNGTALTNITVCVDDVVFAQTQ